MTIEERLAAAGLGPLDRLSWLEIDLDALAGNLRAIADLASGAEVYAVVKSDGYGHGIVAAARAFIGAGASKLCVAGLDEALRLRAAGIDAPILVLFQVPAARVLDAVAADIELSASDEPTTIALLDTWQAAGGAGLRLHLEVETGLARGGVPLERVVELARRIVGTTGTSLAGIWTHLAHYADAAVSAAQVALFDQATAALARAGMAVPARHLAASGVLLSGRAPAYEAVRVGLALYGVLPEEVTLSAAGTRAAARLRPAMALKCRAIRIEHLARGAPVGYSGTWRAQRPSIIATLPVGYGDGWQRSSAPQAQALVRGQRVPLVGTVAMDAVIADITGVAQVDRADEFVLLGRQGDDEITVAELAHYRNTITWEVLTAMSARPARVYHAASGLIGVRTARDD